MITDPGLTAQRYRELMLESILVYHYSNPYSEEDLQQIFDRRLAAALQHSSLYGAPDTDPVVYVREKVQPASHRELICMVTSKAGAVEAARKEFAADPQWTKEINFIQVASPGEGQALVAWLQFLTRASHAYLSKSMPQLASQVEEG